MRTQRNIFQMKEQDKITASELNKMEVNNMPEKEFKVMAIKILTGLEKEWRTSLRPSTKRKQNKTKNQMKN